MEFAILRCQPDLQLATSELGKINELLCFAHKDQYPFDILWAAIQVLSDRFGIFWFSFFFSPNVTFWSSCNPNSELATSELEKMREL